MPALLVPDDRMRGQVEALAGIGLPHTMIGTLVGCDAKTLRVHFREELDVGAAKATAEIAKTLYARAKGGDLSAAIFWLKARAGWREKHEVDLNLSGRVEVADEEPVERAALTIIERHLAKLPAPANAA